MLLHLIVQGCVAVAHCARGERQVELAARISTVCDLGGGRLVAAHAIAHRQAQRATALLFIELHSHRPALGGLHGSFDFGELRLIKLRLRLLLLCLLLTLRCSPETASASARRVAFQDGVVLVLLIFLVF
jgi:hypothetical protein